MNHVSFEKRAVPIDFGSFSDTAFLGNPGSIRDRQTPDMDEHAGGNLGNGAPTNAPTMYMVPDFMEKSGQGNNQSTDRPKGSV